MSGRQRKWVIISCCKDRSHGHQHLKTVKLCGPFTCDSSCITAALWMETNKTLLFGCSQLLSWCGHALWTHIHTQRQCMIHSSTEGAGVIHPDPSCGGDIKAQYEWPECWFKETKLLDLVSPWGQSSPRAAHSSTLNRLTLFLLQLVKWDTQCKNVQPEYKQKYARNTFKDKV